MAVTWKGSQARCSVCGLILMADKKEDLFQAMRRHLEAQLQAQTPHSQPDGTRTYTSGKKVQKGFFTVSLQAEAFVWDEVGVTP